MRLLSKFSSIVCAKAAIVLFVFALACSICFSQANVEAGANINWQTTSVSIEPGKAVIEGYFKNDGDAGAGITKFEIWGYIAQYQMDATFSDDHLTVGYLGAGDTINCTFRIHYSSISYYDSNPRYSFKSRVTWN